MSQFTFKPLASPYPRWMGPFSPSRGNDSGFRIRGGILGTCVEESFERTYWSFIQSPASLKLTNLVFSKWRGGRVLFLPGGFVIKPLQNDYEVGQRALIGYFKGSILLKRPLGDVFDMESPGDIHPGDPWPGPKTTGLECVIDGNGSLNCTWYHPTTIGRTEITQRLRGPDLTLAAGFRKARPRDTGGRVRITANGHIITNRQINYSWVSFYVGHIDTSAWSIEWQKEHWIKGGHRRD